MKANTLVRRDPALAAMLGVILSAQAGESDFGTDFEGDFGDEVSGEFGDDFGGRRRRRVNVAQNVAVAKWKQQKMRTASRASLLNPNGGSEVDVERYVFTLSENITLGTAVTFTTLTGTPDTKIRPQRVTTNAPSPMFAFINSIRVSNVNVTVGTGEEDAFNYSCLGVGQSLDMPTLSPSNRATVLGRYSGFVPPGFAPATVVPFSVSFKGPSTLAAGG